MTSELLNKTYVCTCENLRSLALDLRRTFLNRIKSYIKKQPVELVLTITTASPLRITLFSVVLVLT